MNYNNIPNFLIEILEKQYGVNIASEIIRNYSITRKTTFRVNNIKSNIEEIEKELNKNNIEYKNPIWSKEAFIVEKDTQQKIEEMQIYKDGKIYIQSLSSMLPPIILEPKEGQDILDMAAAPGGKTTQIASLTKNKANITACEMNKIRAEKLKYNIEKQGASCVYVMETDSRKIDNFFSFDKILLDAPCSGSGTLNIENKNINTTFTEKLINKSSKTQLELIRKALKVIKSKGEIIYSTCSILECENENIVLKALENENAEIVPINFKGIEEIPLLPTKIEGTILVKPNELYEGFFIAKIRKK